MVPVILEITPHMSKFPSGIIVICMVRITYHNNLLIIGNTDTGSLHTGAGGGLEEIFM